MKLSHYLPYFAVMLLAFVLCLECNPYTVKMRTINHQPVTNFNLEQYLGTWYEIARFPHRFEKDLVGVTATYKKRKDGKIEVLNSGYKDRLDGRHKTARGKAKFAGDSGTGHLKVSFFLFFYADYFVMELDPDYQWALVGSSSPNYLWVLSRKPQMEEALYQSILAKAADRGYDLDKLHRVPQKDPR